MPPVNVIVYSVESYEIDALERLRNEPARPAESADLSFTYLQMRLDGRTAHFARDSQVACIGVTDKADAEVLLKLAHHGVRLLAVRCPTLGGVDVARAAEVGIKICRVPSDSAPALTAQAEFTVGLVLSLIRKTHRAHVRTREQNFRLSGLVGFQLSEKTVGLVGTDKVALSVARILQAFGCRILAYNVFKSEELRRLGGQYVALDELLSRSDVISLHAPSLPSTYHLIREETIAGMREGVAVVNTCHGALMDLPAVLQGIKRGRIGALGLDVLEEEDQIFHRDHYDAVLQQDVLRQLLSLPNVIITSNQSVLTDEALSSVWQVLVRQIASFARGERVPYAIKIDTA